jgi:hypothetical protein
MRLKSAAGRYVEPRKEELELAEKLFAGLFSSKPRLNEISGLARELGFELIPVREAGEDLLVLREMESDRRGRGMYVYRIERSVPVAVEAPHSNDDLYTGILAEKLFLETRACAAAWNTVRRDQPIEGKKAESDLAHLSESIFLAFTRAFASAHPEGVLVQLHGFSRTERKSSAGSQSDAILSGGTESPASWILTTAQCLRDRWGGRFLVYPRDVNELGATTNSEMKALRSLKHGGFLHLEMCLELRRRLKSSAEARKAFWRCLPEKQP